MITEIIMPKLGQTMEEGTIVQWLVAEGDVVEKGDALFQLESDKAVLEAEAPARGQLAKVFQPNGARVPVLAVVGLIADPADDITAYTPSTGGAAASAAAVAEPAPTAAPATGQGKGGRVFASPRARRVARERGVDLALVQGSGPNGRIVEADVLAFAEVQRRATPLARKVAAEAGVDLAGVAGSGPGGRIVQADVDRLGAPAPGPAARGVVPLSGVRARIAERMATSAHTTARVTLTTEVDATRLVEARTQLKEELAESLGFAVGYNDLLIAICARALREHPHMNARLDGDRIRLLDEVHIGLAVDTERGLLVPVVRNADKLGVVEIARALREHVARAREGKSLPDDLTGGTFTITNLGMYGVDAFTPIINLPECAILGVGRIKAQPAVVVGQVAVQQRVWLSLTFDHRLVDGGPAARYLQRVAQLVEEPYLLLA
jgi:pyruvate dehydrogenase E2 component (dihydrolipoamide acetyltransferase)